MELPKIALSEGGMLDGIKSKLGFGTKKDDFNDDDFNEYADYDEYTDYDEYGDYDEGYRDSAPRSGAYDEYENARRRTLSSSSASSHAGVTRPRLVSIDDVHANTQLDIDARSAGNSSASAQPVFDTPEWNLRSEGLNSLFSPTTNTSTQPSFSRAPVETPTFERPAVVSPLSEQPTLRPAGAGYEAFAPARPASFSSARNIVVIKPQSYNDVERVAKTVRSGDVILLNLRSTQDALSRRLMDFSFGVASALDARVDCAADKVFVICLGESLSQTELQNLKVQGAL